MMTIGCAWSRCRPPPVIEAALPPHRQRRPRLPSPCARALRCHSGSDCRSRRRRSTFLRRSAARRCPHPRLAEAHPRSPGPCHAGRPSLHSRPPSCSAARSGRRPIYLPMLFFLRPFTEAVSAVKSRSREYGTRWRVNRLSRWSVSTLYDPVLPPTCSQQQQQHAIGAITTHK